MVHHQGLQSDSDGHRHQQQRNADRDTRSTKQPQHIPVVTVDIGGTKYLVSTRGESQWVRNVRDDPNVTLTSRSGAHRYVARETPASEREPVLNAYRKKAGKVVEAYFRKLPELADHPVFALTPS
jgi:hypothetical protein